ncbi:MAG: SulP family inorganic anion transporter [Solirubrobacteraceae bacterium]
MAGEKRAHHRSPFRPPPRPPLRERLVPVVATAPGYRLRDAQRDLIAAVTVVAVAVPAAMGYAEVAGVPAVSGLYALLLPSIAYAVLGSSRQLAVGPDGSIAALVGALVLGTAAAGSADSVRIATTLALLVAGCFLIAFALRLGWIADYLSRPVLVGYLHGVVVVLVVGQIPKLLGLNVTALNPLPQLAEIAREIGETSIPTLIVGATALAILLPLRAIAPRFPAPLVLVGAGIAVASALSLGDHGVALVGAIPSGLPHVALPSSSLHETAGLVPPALALFALAFADGVLIARGFAGRHGQHIDADQELLALGAASATAGLTQGFPIGASSSRTAVADAAGVRTQLAGLYAAAFVAAVLLLLTGPLADLPKAILAAIIVSAAVALVDVEAWRRLAAVDSFELAIAGVTTAGVVITGVLPAVAFAVGLSIVDVVRRSARPHDAVLGWVPELGRYADIAMHEDAQITPGIVVYRLDDRIFFANAHYVKGRMREAVRGAPDPARWLVFDAEGVNHVDIAGMDALRDVARTLAEEGTTLVFARVKSPVLSRLDAVGLTGELGPDRFHATVHDAVDACLRAEHRPARR